MPQPPPLFDRAPFMVFWETTQACDLVCKHCRADAQPEADPDELTTEEGKRLLDEIHAMGCPLVVLTGGDPAKRADLTDLVRHGTSIGLRVALTPSATPLVTRELLERLRAAGLARLAVSLDGATAEAHDGFRGVDGSFARTFEILRDAHALGLTTQVNTTVTDLDVDDLERVAAVYRDHPVFRELRDPERLDGKCGLCEFRPICGGSRARAYAMTGDLFAEEPACAWEPGMGGAVQ